MCCWALVRSVRPAWCVRLWGDAGPPHGQDRAGQGSGLELLDSSGCAVRGDVKGGSGEATRGPDADQDLLAETGGGRRRHDAAGVHEKTAGRWPRGRGILENTRPVLQIATSSFLIFSWRETRRGPPGPVRTAHGH